MLRKPLDNAPPTPQEKTENHHRSVTPAFFAFFPSKKKQLRAKHQKKVALIMIGLKFLNPKEPVDHHLPHPIGTEQPPLREHCQ